MTSIIQIFKTNDLRTGSKDGRAWQMQDCECALLSDTGAIEQVGVLPLPKNMTGDAAPLPGIYLGSFALQVGMKDRRIGAVLTSLTPYPAAKPATATKAGV